MTVLLLAAAVFLLLHLLVAGTRLRDAVTGAIGEGPYMGAFSAASIAALAWLIWAFAHARGGAGDAAWWSVTPLTRDIQIAVQFVAMLLIVPGLATRNPSSVGQQEAVENAEVVKGMLRITRHPFLWGVALWAAGHLLVAGDAAGIVLFGSMLILALFGTVSIDAKRRRKLGVAWEAFSARTSSIPFAAIAAGRQKLSLGEIGAWRILLAIAVWAALLFGHRFLFGVSALG